MSWFQPLLEKIPLKIDFYTFTINVFKLKIKLFKLKGKLFRLKKRWEKLDFEL